MLRVCKSYITFNEINSMKKSVATVARSTRTLNKLLVHLACFPNRPNFVGESNSSIESNQNVSVTAKLLFC